MMVIKGGETIFIATQPSPNVKLIVILVTH